MMGGWADGCMDGWINGWMHGLIKYCIFHTKKIQLKLLLPTPVYTILYYTVLPYIYIYITYVMVYYTVLYILYTMLY